MALTSSTPLLLELAYPCPAVRDADFGRTRALPSGGQGERAHTRCAPSPPAPPRSIPRRSRGADPPVTPLAHPSGAHAEWPLRALFKVAPLGHTVGGPSVPHARAAGSLTTAKEGTVQSRLQPGLRKPAPIRSLPLRNIERRGRGRSGEVESYAPTNPT